MPQISDSRDLLNIIIALSVLLLTFFSCWAIYYFAAILRQFFQVIKEIRDRLNKFDELMQTVKEKIEHSASYLFLIGEGIKTLLEVVRQRSEKKKKSKKE